MIPNELLEILCCPLTRQSLTPLDEIRIRQINEAIQQGTLKNQAGQIVTEPIEGGLITADRSRAYAIRENIPILLIEEAIPMASFAA